MMNKIIAAVKKKGLEFGQLTFGDCVDIAKSTGLRVSEVIITEARQVNQMTESEVKSAIIASFSHNLYAMEVGRTTGSSFLFGTVGRELSGPQAPPLFADAFLNKVIVYTLSSQVGNHSCGLEPCAGTGDSCTYTGFMQALLEEVEDQDVIARVMAVILKLGTIFRVGKTTTGCNMEGFGAGAAASAAAFTELAGGSPEQMEKAVVLALSPTIGNPCTPRVMVAGLCATHIGGGVLIGKLASQLALETSIPVNVPADVMIAMAAAVHPASAKAIVPVVIKYMEPFFKTNHGVEGYVDSGVKELEEQRKEDILQDAQKEARSLAQRANSIVKPFGTAVVGGSSQAVGSPTNTARIAHFLVTGEVKKVTIELYPELFARRGINVPGILMAAVYGAATDNSILYREIMDKVKEKKIEVEILQSDVPQMQKITIETTEGKSVIEALNRGGGRLALISAFPDMVEARKIAKRNEIEIVD